MSEDVIQRTTLWRSGFGERHDGRDRDRKELEQALLTFRRRTAQLLSLIHGDMRDYTVHDIDHIDGLWELGEIIAGPEYTLNPSEAFVFGGSLLLHDAGMTVAAYEHGLNELKATPEWNDNFQASRRIFSVPPERMDEDLIQDKDIFSFTVAATLRDLHARRAESLVKQRWTAPGSTDSQFLLDHDEYRNFYGEIIGQIAASHHWDITQVLNRFNAPLGAYPGHPAEWTVNKIKIALLLRCSDAAHIDARRAPRLLFALTQPTGISVHHWQFQSKIAKPCLANERLLYTSSSAFDVSETEAWQLAWDTVRMIERELLGANDALGVRNLPKFAARGVAGASASTALAEFITVRGWQPVLAEIKVSDVAHLARSLGGQGLYSAEYVPLRELIQNSADAIDARAQIDPEFRPNEGKITIRIAREGAEEDRIISVTDNGLGMSESVLAGPLIDFGNSFWKSPLARSEYPGLQGTLREPRGRFGIGFFSAFMWADEVLVASRPFATGRDDTKVLHFRGGLGRNPILRNALPGEVLGSASTRAESGQERS